MFPCWKLRERKWGTLEPLLIFLGSVARGFKLGSTDREVGEICVLNLKLARQTAY